MKRIIYIVILLLPVAVSAQESWLKGSPLGYAWKTVGTVGFSAGMAIPANIALNPSGEAYVAYGDGANSWKVSVMKFDGIQWVYVQIGANLKKSRSRSLMEQIGLRWGLQAFLRVKQCI